MRPFLDRLLNVLLFGLIFLKNGADFAKAIKLWLFPSEGDCFFSACGVADVRIASCHN